MEEFPKETFEQGNEGGLSEEVQELANMANTMDDREDDNPNKPWYDERHQDGVGDPNILARYLEEKAAREKETIDTKESFEKRLETNEALYDKVAYSRAEALVDAKHRQRAVGTPSLEVEQRMDDAWLNSNHLMSSLYQGVIKTDPSDLTLITGRHHYSSGEDVSYIIPKDFDSDFENSFEWFKEANQPRFVADTLVPFEAENMMDTSRYEKKLSEYLDKQNDEITLRDVVNTINIMDALNEKTGFLFNNALGGKELTPSKDVEIIPSLRSRVNLENLFLQVMKKNAEIGTPADKKQFNEMIKDNDETKEIADRLGIEALN